MSVVRLSGEPLSRAVRAAVSDRIADLRTEGVQPTLGTVLMSDDGAAGRFMDLKHRACDAVGIETRDVRLDPDAPAPRLYRAIDRLSAAPDVDAVFVQLPLAGDVDPLAVSRRIDPRTDVDCLHPENVGRLVAGTPRFVPATTAAICRLLSWYDIGISGTHAVIVGRSDVVGKPLANRLLWDAPTGNATVTVCHSRTADLQAVTRRGDVLITACGVPELIDGSMVAPGAVVVDVSANRQPSPGGESHRTVGDVEYESARRVASAITPVPGGVGPVTIAMLLKNVVSAAATDRTPPTET
ncbi:MAG: bifunctional 5,10-methylenetetrahydrofolate dehydrogenase/5,10-methenyltetrahydrofolate cyclohydrolase [Halobacteriota archaeon]